MSDDKSLAVTGGLDFEKLFEKAVDVFNDQALIEKDAGSITITDLEKSRAKAGNFLDALAGIVEVTHTADILSAQKNSFKRDKELKVLNSLLHSCHLGAATLEKTTKIAYKRMKEMLENPEDVTPEQIAMLQAVQATNIESGQKLIASMSRLIQLERFSGSRPWGNSRGKGLGNVKMLEHLNNNEGDEDNAGSGAQPVTELSIEDLT